MAIDQTSGNSSIAFWAVCPTAEHFPEQVASSHWAQGDKSRPLISVSSLTKWTHKEKKKKQRLIKPRRCGIGSRVAWEGLADMSLIYIHVDFLRWGVWFCSGWRSWERATGISIQDRIGAINTPNGSRLYTGHPVPLASDWQGKLRLNPDLLIPRSLKKHTSQQRMLGATQLATSLAFYPQPLVENLGCNRCSFNIYRTNECTHHRPINY